MRDVGVVDETIRWDQVVPGDRVTATEGKAEVWDVNEHRADGLVVVQHGTTLRRFVAGGAPVRRVFSADAAAKAAQDVVISVLGGAVIYRSDEDTSYWPPEFEHPGSLAAHLHIAHGADVTGSADLIALRARHETLHDARGGYHEGYVAHEHTPDWRTR